MTLHGLLKIAPRSGSDWTEQELSQLRQLECFCEADSRLEVEFGKTDEHDPWCIFQAEEDVLCCIARVDRRYILTFPSFGRTSASAAIEPLIEAARAALLRFVETGTSGRGRPALDNRTTSDPASLSSRGTQSSAAHPLAAATMRSKSGKR